MPDDDYTESREFSAPYVRVRGRVSRSAEVNWSPCLRTHKRPKQPSAPPQPLTQGDEEKIEPAGAVYDGGYLVTLLDYRDERLDSAPVVPQFFSHDRQWAPFVVRLPYHPQVQAIALLHDERELGRLTVPADRPFFTLLHPTEDDFIDPAGVLHLYWAGHDSEHPMTFYIRYTHNGRDWLRPGVNLHASDYYLDLRQMPGGRRCVAQVLATNGYRTSYVQTRHFEVPVKAPEVLVTSSDGPVLLAQGFSPQHGALAAQAVTWLGEDGRRLQQGTSLDVRSLPHGIHRISVAVTDQTGLERIEPVGTYDSATGAVITTAQPL